MLEVSSVTSSFWSSLILGFIDMFFLYSQCRIYSPFLYCGYLYYFSSSFFVISVFSGSSYLYLITQIWFGPSPSSIFISFTSLYFFVTLIISSIMYYLAFTFSSVTTFYFYFFCFPLFEGGETGHFYSKKVQKQAD